MNGAHSAWLIALPAGGAVLAALSIFFGSGAAWARRVATWVGFGGGVLAAIEMFYRLRHAGVMTSSLGGWAPPWGVGSSLDGWTSWWILLFFVSVPLVQKGALLEDAGTRARRLSLRLLFLSSGATALLVQDALSRVGAMTLMALSLAGVLMEERHRTAGEGARPPFDFFVRASLGSAVGLMGVALLFVRTGTFDLGGWSSFLASGLAFPAVGAAFLLLCLGAWIQSGLYPAPGWQGAAWTDSPVGAVERVWFSRWSLLVAIDVVRHVAVAPSGMAALRLFEATRWAAWAVFALCLLTAFTTSDRRRMWGRLDVASLALLWALSSCAAPVTLALAAAQCLGLSLGALAPATTRPAGLFALRSAAALLLPGWWVLSLPGGKELLGGSWVLVGALVALTAVVFRVARPLASEESMVAAGERRFLLMGVVALGGYGMLLLLR